MQFLLMNRVQVQSAACATTPPKKTKTSRLRSLLLASVPLAAVLALPSMAQDIETDLTSPVTSSTIDNGSPGDVIITDDGSITITEQDSVTAVTIDSDNDFENEGDILIEDGDDAVGLRITADRTSDITHTGTLSVSETYEREDEDEDDDVDGPYAIGSNRIGILLEEGGTHTGDIVTIAGSSIIVEGNQSAGILLNSILDGGLTLDGSLSVVGDEALGVGIYEDVTGDVRLSGTVITTGEDAASVEIEGNVDGALTVESALQSTGFASTSASNYVAPSAFDDDTPDLSDRIDAEDLLDNRGGFILTGSVTNGLLINGSVDDFTSEEDTEDETKDTVDDFDENRSFGSISSFGSGTALYIGTGVEDEDIVIGTVVETVRDTTDDDEDDDTSETLAVFDYDYGFINRGSIRASGLNIGFDAEAVRIEGDSERGLTTTITGGIQNTGTISALAFGADANGIVIGNGAVVSRLDNAGTISATTYTTDGNTAIALQIAEDVELSELTNTGDINVSGIGETANVTAILSQNGSLRSVTNQGGILASLSSDGLEVEDPGDAIAIDFSAYGSDEGVTLIQSRQTPVDDTNFDDEINSDDVRTPYIIGDILFGAGSDTFDLTVGNVDGDTDFGLGDALFDIANATYAGDISFSDGAHALSVDDASVEGEIAFTNSTAQLSFIDGAEFFGTIETDNALLELSVIDSSLEFEAGNRTSLTSLNVTGASDLVFDIDPSETDGAILSVSGAAQIGDSVVITPILSSISQTSFSQTLIDAGSLIFGGDLSGLDVEDVPYIYTASLVLNDAERTSLDLNFDLKSADELELDANQAAALDTLISVFQSDDDLGAALASITEKSDFDQTYNLLLPQRTNASMRYLVSQSNASIGALGDRLDILGFTDNTEAGFWIQEHFATLNQDSQEDTPGFNGGGVGLSLGADRSFFGIDTIGVMMTYSSGSFEEKTGGFNPVTTTQFGVGAYAQEKIGPLQIRAAAQIADVGFASAREVDVGALFYDIDGEWGGMSQSATIGVSSEFKSGAYYARPEINADWISLSQDAYVETGGEDLLNAEIQDVKTDEASANALLTLGREFEFKSGLLRAEVAGGYKTVLSSTPFESTISYLGADDYVTLYAPDDATDAALLGLSLTSDSSLLSTRFGYDVEVSEFGTVHYAGASIRLKF